MPRAAKVRSWVERIRRKGWVAHAWRTGHRYVHRLGDQFAGALTFNSILAMVPVLMFGFSMVGMTLTVIRPDWLDSVQDIITTMLGSVVGGQRIATLIDGFLAGWRGVGLVGLVIGLVAGLGWVNSVRSALHALCRPGFDVEVDQRNFVVQKIRDLGLLIAVLVLVSLVLSSGSIGSWLGPHLLEWARLEGFPGRKVLVQVLALLISVLFGYLLFVFIYRVVADVPMMIGALRRGSLLAAVLVAILQFIAPWLIGILGRNRGVQLFGTVIVVMVMLSIFARVVLIVATWIATANQPAMARRYIDADEPIRTMPEALTVPDHWQAVDSLRTEEDGDDVEVPELEKRRTRRRWGSTGH